METPGERSPIFSACCFGLDSANGVSCGQSDVIEKKRNNTDLRRGQGETSCGYVISEYEPEIKFGRSQNLS